MKVLDRFLSYVTLMTPSDEESPSTPSTPCQLVLADRLKEELQGLGLEAQRDDLGYVYGRLPASPGLEKEKCLGFIAHMDTVSDFTIKTVCPLVHKYYDGHDLALGESGRSLTEKAFPHLPLLAGRTLITSDGETILGADDKAGIAEIMTLLETLQTYGFRHGPLAVAFTPDEEIGRGADHFDLNRFGADFAYTVDGGAEGEIEYENFNAAKAVVTFTGVNVHPGDAKNVMVNASALAAEFISSLPKGESPRDTEGYEGFYHLTKMQGDVASASLSFIIRDHDSQKFAQRKRLLTELTGSFNTRFGEGTAVLAITDQYQNMAEKIKDHFHLIINAKMAAVRANISPCVKPIRGGTDGARLSFMGLPCPNLGTGGYAFHGPYEHITVEGMEKTVKMLLQLVGIYSGEENMSCDH